MHYLYKIFYGYMFLYLSEHFSCFFKNHFCWLSCYFCIFMNNMLAYSLKSYLISCLPCLYVTLVVGPIFIPKFFARPSLVRHNYCSSIVIHQLDPVIKQQKSSHY